MQKLMGEDFIGPTKLFTEAQQAIKSKKGYYAVRVGDGENAVLDLKNLSEGYCGIKSPNPQARDDLIAAIKDANAVGVFACDTWTEELFDRHQILPKAIFYAFDNLCWGDIKPFVQILAHCKILLIGRPMPRFAELLKNELNTQVAGIKVINSYHEIQDIMDWAKNIDFDMAVISAGANAVILASRIAKELGKVAVDFGHTADHILLGDRPLNKNLVEHSFL